MMDELLQITGCVQNFREGSNSLLTKIFEQFISCYHESSFANWEPEDCGRSPLQFLFCQVSWHESWHGHGQLGLDGKQAELSMIYFFPEATVLHAAGLPERHLCQCSYPTSWRSGISSENDGPILPIYVVDSKKNSRYWKEQVEGFLPSSLVNLVFLGFLVQWWQLIT